MSKFTRRSFLGASTAGAFLGASAGQSPVLANSEPSAADKVVFKGDGIIHTPNEYAKLMVELAEEGVVADFYLKGGCVAELEERFAEDLGKEAAVFVPTGTLANHLAIRIQAAGRSRALVQAESHIYRDESDCVQTLSNLNLVPLGRDKATVPLEEFEDAFRRSGEKPFPLRVGVIALECPVRRKSGEIFDFSQMQRIAAFAREHDIKMHLDGARLWIASAHTSISPKDYASLFDTVYVSLYKYFNAGAGAILAGPRTTIEQVRDARKVFGSMVFQGWTNAAVALHYMDGFMERYQRAIDGLRALFSRLEKHPQFRIERIPNGTNVVRLHVDEIEAIRFRTALRRQGVFLRSPSKHFSGFELVINETLNRRSPDELATVFIDSLSS